MKIQRRFQTIEGTSKSKIPRKNFGETKDVASAFALGWSIMEEGSEPVDPSRLSKRPKMEGSEQPEDKNGSARALIEMRFRDTSSLDEVSGIEA